MTTTPTPSPSSLELDRPRAAVECACLDRKPGDLHAVDCPIAEILNRPGIIPQAHKPLRGAALKAAMKKLERVPSDELAKLGTSEAIALLLERNTWQAGVMGKKDATIAILRSQVEDLQKLATDKDQALERYSGTATEYEHQLHQAQEATKAAQAEREQLRQDLEAQKAANARMADDLKTALGKIDLLTQQVAESGAKAVKAIVQREQTEDMLAQHVRTLVEIIREGDQEKAEQARRLADLEGKIAKLAEA